MEIYAVREFGRLVPTSPFYAEELDALDGSGPFRVKITKARSLPHNALYWVCLQAMVKAGAATSRDDIHDATKLKCGLVRMARTPDGEFYAFPDSAAFHRMDQMAFRAFFDKAIEFWKSCKLWDYLPPDLQQKLSEGAR